MTLYPKDHRENLEWRFEILAKAKQDLTYRMTVKELFHRDPLFAFNAFFYTFDPRKRPFHHQPFCTYEFQDETILALVEQINKGEDLILEKSRDMGCSWMIILVFLWFWLDPRGGADFLLGSRIEDYVDKKGDMRTLLEKARYALYKLPKWLRPKGFKRNKHDNFMRLVNPETGASITGESNNPNWSTGGRYAAGLMDEFAKWESTDKAAWTAAGDATPCRIALSTPFGAAGQYFELVTNENKYKITLHWSRHPDKCDGLYCVYPKPEDADDLVDEDHWVGLRSPWYDKESVRRDPLEVAQELDIDYIGAGNPVFGGKAGKRIGQIMRSPIKPLRFYVPDFERRILVEDNNPIDDELGVVKVFFEPDSLKSYIIAADVAEGKEDGDFTIIKVLERESVSVAATYAARIDESLGAEVLYLITKMYTLEGADEPWWAVETNGPGLGMFNLLVDPDKYDLPNPFMMQKYDTAKQAISYRKGWWTDTSSRRQLVTGIRTWLLSGSGWCDARCAREFTTFVYRNNKPQAKEGAHDDEVMCFGIALMVNEAVPEADAPKDLKSIRPLSAKDVADKRNWREVERERFDELCMATLDFKRQTLEDIAAQYIETYSAEVEMILDQFRSNL
jgi:hypothetical protein